MVLFMIFRLSQKLATKLKEGNLPSVPLDENPYADWSAHLFTADRTQYIIVANMKALYSVVMFGKGIPGLEVRIVDGNHLAGTQHRLKALRRLGDAALPGHTIAVLNPQRQLIEEMVVCEDGHANQKPLFVRLLSRIPPEQCWIADSDFGTCDFMFGVAGRNAYFLVRQHGALQGEMLGRRRRLGCVATGVVYEQRMRVTHRDGRSMEVRRLTLELDEPTRDGDTEIHLLTNLPAKFAGRLLARAYLARWQIEAAFQKLTQVLRCELNTLGYPPAALFGFCLAVVMYNALNTVITALVHLTSRAKS
jgi:hypothetical protein